MISDEEILKVILFNIKKKEVKEEELDPLLPITYNEVVKFYDKVILYLK